MPAMTTRFSIRLLAALLILTGLLTGFHLQAAQAVDVAQSPQPLPRFEPESCPEIPLGQRPVNHVQGNPDYKAKCGYVVVPEDYAAQKPLEIRLRVLVMTSQSKDRKADPLIFLEGGPGGSAVDSRRLQAEAGNISITDRDLVFFDQRGAGKSTPSLDCPELDLPAPATHLTAAAQNQRLIDALRKCRERIVKEGKIGNLAAYNSLNNARDVEALRVALGYEKVNLFGVSYGSLLAQHVMRLFPGSLRSVILDAVVPLGLNWNALVFSTSPRSLAEIGAACAANAHCNYWYPNFQRDLLAVFYRLEKQPVTVKIKDGAGEKVLVDGHAYADKIFKYFYSSEKLGKIPQLVHDAVHERYPEFEIKDPLGGISDGMHQSIYCTEFPSFDASKIEMAKLHPFMQESAPLNTQFYNAACGLWIPQRTSIGEQKPLQSDIPTLLLSGRFDPITPPDFAVQVAKGLKSSQAYTDPVGGHGQFSQRPCAMEKIASFVANPLKPAGCSKIEAEVNFEVNQLQVRADQAADWGKNVFEGSKDKAEQLAESARATAEAGAQRWLDDQRKTAEAGAKKFVATQIPRLIPTTCPGAAIPPGAVLVGAWFVRRRGKR